MYRGLNPRRVEKRTAHNELATQLEDYINGEFQACGRDHETFIYGYVANALGIPVEDVRRLLFSLEGGHNGFSVWRPRSHDGTAGSAGKPKGRDEP
jgi:hypothetical protein